MKSMKLHQHEIEHIRHMRRIDAGAAKELRRIASQFPSADGAPALKPQGNVVPLHRGMHLLEGTQH